MEAVEISRVLAGLSSVRVTTMADRVCAYLPAIDDTVHVEATEVRRFRHIWAPNGDPAVEFVMGDEHGTWPLIITPNDIIYKPVDTEAVLDSVIEYQISNAPHIVAYSEMERAAERAALASERSGSIDVDSVGASFLLVRCFIAAATLVGLRPVRSVAWWQRGWAALGGDLPLPPFRADPVWDELSRDASRLTVTALLTREDDMAEAIANLTIADFRQLEPVLTAVGLDDEFVSSWRTLIRIAPAQFADRLLDGMETALADVALYPEGGGSVNVVLRDGDVVHALLQFSWSSRDELHIDEIRIGDTMAHTGLFQRLMFNTERLAALLGFRKVALLASGIGSVAFATMGYPRDPELYRTMRHGRQ